MKPLILLGYISYGPYHLARLQACRKSLSGLEVVGWELTCEQSEYGWRHTSSDYLYAVTTAKLETVSAFQWAVKVWRNLSRLKPSICVLAGYSHPGMLAALVWCKVHGRPVVIMSDSKEDDTPRNALIEWFKGKLLGLYDSALVAGKPHREYFIRLGFPAERIHTGYDVVDNGAYALNQPRPIMVEGPYFLVVCRMVTKKNLAMVVDAYSDYFHIRGAGGAWSLVICGDGPLRQALERQIDMLGLSNRIFLTGFMQMEELLPLYKHAKVFIHASLQEQWGLVVNEAMAAGLPVILSETCGCFADLVQVGINGFGFDPKMPDELTDIMLRVHKLPEDARRRMGEAAHQWINQCHSLEHFAKNLNACILQAIDN